ncbi:hypothetical protein CBL_10350 [Carabus blaptoides fortunei]
MHDSLTAAAGRVQVSLRRSFVFETVQMAAAERMIPGLLVSQQNTGGQYQETSRILSKCTHSSTEIATHVPYLAIIKLSSVRDPFIETHGWPCAKLTEPAPGPRNNTRLAKSTQARCKLRRVTLGLLNNTTTTISRHRASVAEHTRPSPPLPLPPACVIMYLLVAWHITDAIWQSFLNMPVRQIHTVTGILQDPCSDISECFTFSH